MILDTGTDELLGALDDGVAVLTLNRPAARNALSDRLTPAGSSEGRISRTRRRGDRGGMMAARVLDEITGGIVDAAYKLHTGLGPGLVEIGLRDGAGA